MKALVMRKLGLQKNWKKYGIVVFLLFLLKGLIWLAIGYFGYRMAK